LVSWIPASAGMTKLRYHNCPDGTSGRLPPKKDEGYGAEELHPSAL